MRRFDGKRNRKKKGLALVIVIGLVLVLAILAWVILSLGGGHYYSTASQIKRVKAYYLAEGGVQHALWAIGTNNLPSIPTPATPTTILLNVDADATTGPGGNETTVTISVHSPGTPPAGVVYDIESRVNPAQIPAQ